MTTQKRVHFRLKGETEMKHLTMDVTKLDVRFDTHHSAITIHKTQKGKRDPYLDTSEIVAAIMDVAEMFVQVENVDPAYQAAMANTRRENEELEQELEQVERPGVASAARYARYTDSEGYTTNEPNEFDDIY